MEKKTFDLFALLEAYKIGIQQWVAFGEYWRQEQGKHFIRTPNNYTHLLFHQMMCELRDHRAHTEANCSLFFQKILVREKFTFIFQAKDYFLPLPYVVSVVIFWVLNTNL